MLEAERVGEDDEEEDQVQFGGFWLVMAATRMYALNPVGSAPAFRAVLALRLYCAVVPLFTMYYSGYFCYMVITTIEDNNAPHIVLQCLLALCFLAMTVASATFLAGSFRKAVLLPRLLRQSLTASSAFQPSVAEVVVQLVVLLGSYTFLSAVFFFKSWRLDSTSGGVAIASVFLFAMSAAEKLALGHLVRRVGLRFDHVNEALEFAKHVVLLRGAEGAYPQVATRVAEARVTHQACCRLLACLTLCFEASLIGVLFMDFVVLLACTYLSSFLLRLLEHEAALVFLLVGFVGNSVFCITGTYMLARTCHLACREARRTHACVHALLNLQHVSIEEAELLKAFSLQLLHARPSISPFRLFAVDYTLFSSLALAFFTYVIIIGQFGVSVTDYGPYANITAAPNGTAFMDVDYDSYSDED